MEETMSNAWHIRKLKKKQKFKVDKAHEYSITEYNLETFNYYIVQESFLGSLLYYTISRNEI